MAGNGNVGWPRPAAVDRSRGTLTDDEMRELFAALRGAGGSERDEVIRPVRGLPLCQSPSLVSSRLRRAWPYMLTSLATSVTRNTWPINASNVTMTRPVSVPGVRSP